MSVGRWISLDYHDITGTFIFTVNDYEMCYSNLVDNYDANGLKPNKDRYKPRRLGRPQPVLKPGPGKPITMNPKNILRKCGRGIKHTVFSPVRAVTCGGCLSGLVAIEGICAFFTDDSPGFLGCVCNEYDKNYVLKKACNSCVPGTMGVASWWANCD